MNVMEEAIFNPVESLRRLRNDRDLFKELVQFFLEDQEGLLEQVDLGMSSNDFERIRRGAHSLKGLMAGFDGFGGVRAAAAVEVRRFGEDEAGDRAAVRELREETAKLCRALCEWRQTTD